MDSTILVNLVDTITDNSFHLFASMHSGLRVGSYIPGEERCARRPCHWSYNMNFVYNYFENPTK